MKDAKDVVVALCAPMYDMFNALDGHDDLKRTAQVVADTFRACMCDDDDEPKQ